eukprot:92155_1
MVQFHPTQFTTNLNKMIQYMMLFAIVYYTIYSYTFRNYTTITSQNSKHKLPNIGYLGRGYNLVKGNPQSIYGKPAKDPGFESSIFDFSYTSGTRTSDEIYLIPDCTHGHTLSICQFTSSQSTYRGVISYSKHLSQAISISGPYSQQLTNVSFSNSASYKTINQATSSGQKIYQSASGKCAAYQVYLDLDQISHISVTSAFSQSVSKLPLFINTSNPNDPYFAFINKYGTHYVKSLKMGSKYSKTYEFSRHIWSNFQNKRWNLNSVISTSYAIATGNTSSITLKQKQQAKEYEDSASVIYNTILGNKPPIDGNASKWKLDSINNPYPYEYELSSITNLLTNIYFPNTLQSIIQVKQQKMVQALSMYCSIIDGCLQHENIINDETIFMHKVVQRKLASHIPCCTNQTDDPDFGCCQSISFVGDGAGEFEEHLEEGCLCTNVDSTIYGAVAPGSVTGPYYNHPLIFEIQILWDGNLTFDANGSNFMITSITAINNVDGMVIGTTDSSILTLYNIGSGNYTFVVEGETGTTNGQFDIQITPDPIAPPGSANTTATPTSPTVAPPGSANTTATPTAPTVAPPGSSNTTATPTAPTASPPGSSN